MLQDGSVDVKFIEILPIDDFEEVINEMSWKQIEYLFSFATPAQGPVNPIKVDYALEELEDWGFGFDGDKVLKRLREGIR